MKSHTPLPVSLGILMCSFAVMFCAPGQGIIVPRDIWYWPEVVKNHEADHEELSTGSEGSEADNELTVKKKKKKKRNIYYNKYGCDKYQVKMFSTLCPCIFSHY